MIIGMRGTVTVASSRGALSYLGIASWCVKGGR